MLKKNIANSPAPTKNMLTFAGRERADAEDGQAHERRLRPELDHDEGDEQHRRDTEELERARRRPAVLLRRDDRVDERHQPTRHGDGAGDVEAPVRRSSLDSGT